MNDKQQVFCAITGYDVHGITGAKDDYYFDECHTQEEKKGQISGHAENALDIYLSDDAINEVYLAIENSRGGSAHDTYYIYKSLDAQGD